VRPDPTGETTTVSIAVGLTDLIAINDLDQSVTLDALLTLRWQDRRLNQASGCRFLLSEVWNPDIQLINSGEISTRAAPQVSVEPGGWVRGDVRFRGAIANPHRMDEFPFDAHDIKLEITSLRYTSEEVRFEVAEGGPVRRSELTIPDWEVGEPTAVAKDVLLPQLQRNVSIFEFKLPVVRLSEYYVYKIILPLTMIVLMSWGVFWIDPNRLDPQMALAGTSMLTLIAFQFTLNEILPRVGYFTAMDRFTLISSVLVFMALVEALTTGYLALHGRMRAAQMVDRASRWGFPLAFSIVVIATLVA
jgi:hypothetical protein